MKKQCKRERVDSHKNAVYLGINERQQQMYSRIDKQAMVSTLAGEDENRELMEKLSRLRSMGNYLVKVRSVGKTECSGLYRSVAEIRLANRSGKHPIMLMIYFNQTKSDRGPVRMEISPQHYTADELTSLFLWLGKKGRLGKRLYQLLKNAWITDIHYALDVVGMKMHDYFIGLHRARDGEFHDREGQEEGLRLGAATVVASIYAKVDTRSLSVEERNALPFLTLNKGEYVDFLRLELRFRPGKGKLMLKDLQDMENLISRLAFYDPALQHDSRLPHAFRGLLRYQSVPRARRLFRQSDVPDWWRNFRSQKAALKCIDKVMKEHRVNVFDANSIWQRLPQVIDKLGILGQPQYWQLDIRKKWLKSRGK